MKIRFNHRYLLRFLTILCGILSVFFGLPVFIVALYLHFVEGFSGLLFWTLISLLFIVSLIQSIGSTFYTDVDTTIGALMMRYVFTNSSFNEVPVSEYLKVLSKKKGFNLFDEEDEMNFFGKIFPFPRKKYHNPPVSILVCDKNSETPLSQDLTFSINRKHWIILRNHPSEMTNFNHFQLLHEIGHMSNVTKFYNLNVLFMRQRHRFTSCFLFVFMDIKAILFCIPLVLAIEYLMNLSVAVRQLSGHEAEELYADYYAFCRSSKKWFEGLSTERLAKFHVDSTGKNTSKEELIKEINNSRFRKKVKFLFEEKMKREDRKKIFKINVERLSKNEKPIFDFQYLKSAKKWNLSDQSLILTLIIYMCFALIIFTFLLSVNQINSFRVVYGGLLSFVFLFVTIFQFQSVKGLEDLVDYGFRLKKSITKKSKDAAYYYLYLVTPDKHKDGLILSDLNPKVSVSAYMNGDNKYFLKRTKTNFNSRANAKDIVEYERWECKNCGRETQIANLKYNSKTRDVSCCFCSQICSTHTTKKYLKLMDLM